jgi:hypothetical protein
MKKLAAALLLLSSTLIAGAQNSQTPKSQPAITPLRHHCLPASVFSTTLPSVKISPETMGPGVAFIDTTTTVADIFLVNGTDWPASLQALHVQLLPQQSRRYSSPTSPQSRPRRRTFAV